MDVRSRPRSEAGLADLWSDPHSAPGLRLQTAVCCRQPGSKCETRTRPNHLMNEESGKTGCSETVQKNKQESNLTRELLKKSQPAHDKGWLPGCQEQAEEGGPGKEEYTLCPFCTLPDMSHDGEETSHGRARIKSISGRKRSR